MWSHVFQVDSRSFGSGQQRQRLYGSCFRFRDLHMPVQSAKDLLSETMSLLSGVSTCHPDEYLLPENSAELQVERGLHLMRSYGNETALFCKQGQDSFHIDALFRCGGALPCDFSRNLTRQGAPSKRVLKPCRSDSCPPSPGSKWVRNHAEAFRQSGEDC